MTRFIPSEEIDQQNVRQWHFGSVRANLHQGFIAMPEMTLGPILPAATPAQAMEPVQPEALEPEPLEPEPEEIAAPVAPMFTEEELHQHMQQAAEQARLQAYEQGREQGQQETSQQWQQRMADYQNNMGREAAQHLQEVLHAAQTAVQGMQQQMSQELLQLAVDIAKQVVRQELRCNPQALQPVVAEALDMLGAESKPAVVRLHPDDFQRLQAHLRESLPNPKVEWLADPSVPAGGCLVQSQGAQIDGTLERRWQRAVAALGLVSTWYDEAPHV